MPFRLRLLQRVSWLIRPIVAYRRARMSVAVHGAAVHVTYGVTEQDQLRRAWLCDWRFRIRPDEFYLVRLHDPARFTRASEFFNTQQGYSLQSHLLNLLNPPHRGIGSDKRGFARHCRLHGLATVSPLWDIEDGAETFWNGDSGGRLPDVDLFAKVFVNGQSGAGACRFENVGANKFRDSAGRILDSAGVLDSLRRTRSAGGWLLQPRLRNHDSLTSLSNGALATMRVVTAQSPGRGCELIAVALRLPTGSSVVDNFTAGGLLMEVDPDSGVVITPAYRKCARLGAAMFVRHPDTGVVIQGFQIPEWKEVRELARKAQTSCPDLPFVGWDITLSADGPVLIEANVLFDILGMQTPSARGFAATRFGPLYLDAFIRAGGRAG